MTSEDLEESRQSPHGHEADIETYDDLRGYTVLMIRL